MKIRKPSLLWLLPALAGLTACSLAADVTPPPGYVPPTAAPTPAPVFPASLPDLNQGAALYAENCAPCHGESGLGDGAQAAQLPNPAAAIGSAEVADASTPAEWYQMVTEGNLERFMPGFKAKLSDSQRWDVLAYTYSLSAPAQVLDEGRQLYQASCAACHGESGAGDGERAASLASVPVALNDARSMAQVSLADLTQAIAQGVSPDMPAFQSELSADQIRAVASYARSFSLGGSTLEQAAAETTPAPGAALPAGTLTPPADTPEAADATPAETASAVLGTIRGQVSNGSGGPVPSEGEVTLHGFDGMNEAFTQTTALQPDGSYQFDDVELTAERVYIASLQYNGVIFNSDITHSGEASPDIDLPIIVYETSTDATVLYAERMHVFFDFTNPGTVQVAELFVISNPTDRVIVPASAGQAVVNFELPEEYSNLQFQQGALGDRYVATQTGFGDTQSVPPGAGQYQVLFGYEMPYEKSLELSLSTPLNVTAAVVMVPSGGVGVQSDLLQDNGVRDVQGMQFKVYSVEDLKAGQTLPMKLSGAPNATGGSTPSGAETTGLLVGVGAFGLALVVVGVWFYRRQQAPRAGSAPEAASEPAAAEDSDALIDAIIALDDLYRSGQLPEAAYRERRAELKAQLKERMGSAGDA